MARIFLNHGVDRDGDLIYIGQVPRGRSSLVCPYCAGPLTARKGLHTLPHFAHAGETCRPVKRNQDAIALPAFERFNLDVPGKVMEDLRAWVAPVRSGRVRYSDLVKHGLIENNPYWHGSRNLTKKGMLVLGKLSLKDFDAFQAPLLVARHDELIERAAIAQGRGLRMARMYEIGRVLQEPFGNDIWYVIKYGLSYLPRIRETVVRNLGPMSSPMSSSWSELWRELLDLMRQDNETDPATALTDLRMYRAQWQRILSVSLYFLEVRHTHGILHKIGVTARPLEERIAEIGQDLTRTLKEVKITLLGMWPHRGNVELYFKFRYASFQVRVGNLTEYFCFEDPDEVLYDLQQMKSKTLTPLEEEILRGDDPFPTLAKS